MVWVKKSDLPKMNTVNDLLPLLRVMEDDNLTKFQYIIENGPTLIEKWLRNKNTIEFLGIWEEMYNADFNTAAYEEIMSEARLNRFIMSVKQWVSWVSRTNQIIHYQGI